MIGDAWKRTREGYCRALNWNQFENGCPELGKLAHQRLADVELVLIGTVRRDGSPRISPVEPEFVAGELLLGMMWRSLKTLDLARDPRLTVHSVPSDRLNPRGDTRKCSPANPSGDRLDATPRAWDR